MLTIKKRNMENIDALLVKDMSYMFVKLSSIKVVDDSYLNTSSIETMRDMFAFCEQAVTKKCFQF